MPRGAPSPPALLVRWLVRAPRHGSFSKQMMALDAKKQRFGGRLGSPNLPVLCRETGGDEGGWRELQVLPFRMGQRS